MKMTIKIYQGNDEIISKVLSEGVFRVGRSTLSDIVLSHDSVSRSQLEIRITETSAYFTNMGANGRLKHNGDRIETGELKDGDEITLGPYRMVFFDGEREAIAPVLAPDKSDSEPEELGLEEKEAPDAVLPNPGSLSEGTAALNRIETQLELKPLVAKLLFVDGPKAGEEFKLEAYEVSIGRSRKADICIDDEKLSRIHSKITRVGMGYRLIDLNSRNGTYVNGVRILEHPLNSFDEILIGNSRIKFLIHDIVVSESPGKLASYRAQGPESTHSLPPEADEALLELPSPQRSDGEKPGEKPFRWEKIGSNRTPLLLGAIVLLMLFYFALFNEAPETPDKEQNKIVMETEQALPPDIPPEFRDLTDESQRAIEGAYNSALELTKRENYEESIAYLREIHKHLPFYKDSQKLMELLQRKIKEKKIAEAEQRAKEQEKQDLSAFLDEGKEYLREGDFARAEEAFYTALERDPNNEIAAKGVKAAQLKLARIEDIPPEKDPEQEKRQIIDELFRQAGEALSNKRYQDAINTAEKIRQIEIKGETEYLNQAKQIIDNARRNQKDEYETFLVLAKEKFAEGDYNESRNLCEEMTKRDPAYEEAKDCLLKAKNQLQKLAKEAYTHGYILESMGRLDEAKHYFNRAKTFVREGDEYYPKVQRKLDQ